MGVQKNKRMYLQAPMRLLFSFNPIPAGNISNTRPTLSLQSHEGRSNITIFEKKVNLKKLSKYHAEVATY